MALPLLATVDDLAAWVGTIATADETRAEAVLAAASTLVRSETRRAWVVDGGGLDDSDPTIDDDDLEIARTVVVAAAGRVWRNPGGLIAETTGPFSARFADWVAEGLRLTDTEKEMLGPYRTTTSPQIWTLATTSGDVEIGIGAVPAAGEDWVAVAGSDEPLPVPLPEGDLW